MPFAPLPESGFKELCQWLWKKRICIRIEGDSMAPFLVEGDEVLVSLFQHKNESILPGEIVLAFHPYQKSIQIVKRVSYIENDRYFLLGDHHSASTDSRHFGHLSRELLRGKIVSRLLRQKP